MRMVLVFLVRIPPMARHRFPSMRNGYSAAKTGINLFLPGLMLLSSLFFHSTTAGAAFFDSSDNSLALLAGYGQSIPGWGETAQRVETIDLVPRYSHRIFADIGSGWYRGDHSLLVELPLHLVVSPDTSAMVGMNFLACFTFTSGDRMRPYLFGGGGPVYSFADIPGMGAELNGNYQFGIGLEYPLDQDRKMLVEIRYHHISNGGTEDPNDPLNSLKLLAGITF